MDEDSFLKDSNGFFECIVEHDYTAEENDELTMTKGDRIKRCVVMHDGWWEGEINHQRGLFPDNFVRPIRKQQHTTPDTSAGSSNSNDTTSTIEVADAPKMRAKSGLGPHRRRLKAVFSYAPLQDDELKLEVNDVIDFMEEIEEGWWKGELHGRVGIFPSNFVEEVDKDNTTQNGETTQQEGGTKGKETARNRDTFIAKNKVIPDIIPANRTQAKEDPEAAPKLPPKPVRETARCFYPYFASNDDELTLHEGDIITIISKECEDDGWWRGEIRGKTGVFPDNFVEIITPDSPTTLTPTANQPKMTAQERTTGISRNDSKKEAKSTAAATTVVDGASNSKGSVKTENRVTSQLKAFGKKEQQLPFSSSGAIAKGPAPLSPSGSLQPKPFTGFSIKKDLKSPLTSPTIDMPPLGIDGDLDSIERNETLNHLTATRAKAPRRRPPSALITRDDEHEFGLTNGSGSNNPIVMPVQIFKRDPDQMNRQSINVPDAHGASSKESSPAPQTTPTSVNKPKTAIPWMAELKQKQDKKSSNLASPTSPTLTSMANQMNNNNITTVTVSAPGSIMNNVPASTKAPPLPAKPTIATTPHVPEYGKVLKRNSSNPTPPANHVREGYVTIEEHNKLKEHVSHLEDEIEQLKKQIKGLTERDIKGHIV